MNHEKYRYYEPNGQAEDFINAFGSGDYFILINFAANGVGKTAMASNILANLMFPTQNPWFRAKLFHDFPYLKRGRIITDAALVEKNVVNELKFWFPHGKYTTNKGGKHYESQWKTDTGWNFDVMTYDQDPKQFEGVTLGWAWFDEPPPEAILKATIARMRRGGIIMITATPISGSAHLYDMFSEESLEVEIVLREGEEPVKVKRSVHTQTSDVESACKVHGIRGHLEHSDIERMIAEYPEDERQARVYGKFQHLVGLVYKRFSRNIHVIKPFNITERDFIVYEMLDPHPRNPDAVLWVAVDKHGTKYVIDELYMKPDDVRELAERIKNKSQNYRVIYRAIDPWAFNRDQHLNPEDRNLAEMLAENGLTYMPAPKQRTAADKRIEMAINYQEANGHMIRPPELYIFDHCKRTIWEFEHWRWDEWEGKTGDKRDRKEKKVDKDDHMIENLGRALILEPQFVPFVETHNLGVISNDDFDPYS
jgi:phage terminase large subunit-like protein